MSKHTKTATPPKGLWLHRNGQYAAKIARQHFYFGTNLESAIRRFEHDRSYRKRGDVPPPMPDDEASPEYVSIDELCNRFLAHVDGKLKDGTIGHRQYALYREACKQVIATFGRTRNADDLKPADFARLRMFLVNKYCVRSRHNRMTYIIAIFRYGERNLLLAYPAKFGDEFNRPSKDQIRKHQAGRDAKFTHEEVTLLLEAAPQPLKAMILLGLNAALGQSDLAAMTWSAINFKSGWLDYARRKNGIPRHVPLWPQTLEALTEWKALRPTPADPAEADLVFLTRTGRRYVRETYSRTGGLVIGDDVVKQFRALEEEVAIKRRGRSFYGLRHVMANIGSSARDGDAVRAILGHTPQAGDMMHDSYVLMDFWKTADGEARLRTVTDHVRHWVFGTRA